MKSNEGIIITNGNITADQIAVGKTATITINNAEQENSLNSKIDSLIRLLEAERDQINNYDDLKKAGEAIKNEINKEEPDKNILSMISNSVPTISSITKAVSTFKEAIELFVK